MTPCLIGSNVAIRYLKAYDAHVSYWHEVNPVVQLAYVDKPDHVGYLREYAAALPNSLIVARVGHPLDGGFHLAPTAPGDTRRYVASPNDYHNQYGDLGRVSNMWLNILNEPNGFAPPDETMRLVAWMTEYINLAIASKTKSVLFNWADHHPKIVSGMWDGVYDSILKLMAAHPELFIMGLHLYGPDEIVSALDAYIARCNFLGIKPPRVIATEFGIDSTGGTQRGYKDWPNYKDIYGAWQRIQVRGSLATYFKSGLLIGLCTFQEGNSGGWESFDIENDTAYKAEIKRAALAGEINTLTPTPVPIEPPPVVIPPTSPPVRSVSVPLTVLAGIRQGIQGTIDVNSRYIVQVSAITKDLEDELAVIDELIRSALST